MMKPGLSSLYASRQNVDRFLRPTPLHRYAGLSALPGAEVCLKYLHNLAEGAGAVSLAAALALKDRLAGSKVVLVLSGGNLHVDVLHGILSE